MTSAIVILWADEEPIASLDMNIVLVGMKSQNFNQLKDKIVPCRVKSAPSSPPLWPRVMPLSLTAARISSRPEWR